MAGKYKVLLYYSNAIFFKQSPTCPVCNPSKCRSIVCNKPICQKGETLVTRRDSNGCLQCPQCYKLNTACPIFKCSMRACSSKEVRVVRTNSRGCKQCPICIPATGKAHQVALSELSPIPKNIALAAPSYYPYCPALKCPAVSCDSGYSAVAEKDLETGCYRCAKCRKCPTLMCPRPTSKCTRSKYTRKANGCPASCPVCIQQ